LPDFGNPWSPWHELPVSTALRFSALEPIHFFQALESAIQSKLVEVRDGRLYALTVPPALKGQDLEIPVPEFPSNRSPNSTH
jgi:hypothetical protein